MIQCGSQVRALRTLDCKPLSIYRGFHLADFGDIGWVVSIDTNGDPMVKFAKTVRTALVSKNDIAEAEERQNVTCV